MGRERPNYMIFEALKEEKLFSSSKNNSLNLLLKVKNIKYTNIFFFFFLTSLWYLKTESVIFRNEEVLTY